MLIVQWTEPALEDLDMIYDYVALRSKKNADRLFHALLDASEMLQDSPEAGKLEVSIPDYRFLIVKRLYKLIYYIEDKCVYIASVWDCRQEPMGLSRRLLQLRK